MKVGDLVRHNWSKQIGVIVNIDQGYRPRTYRVMWFNGEIGIHDIMRIEAVKKCP